MSHNETADSNVHSDDTKGLIIIIIIIIISLILGTVYMPLTSEQLWLLFFSPKCIFFSKHREQPCAFCVADF